MATQSFIKNTQPIPAPTDGPKIYLRHPTKPVKIFHYRGYVAHNLIKKCGYIEITKEEYEAGQS